MNDLARKLSFLRVAAQGERPDGRSRSDGDGGMILHRVGVVRAAVEGRDLGALDGLFPQAQFTDVGESWPDRLPPRLDVLVAYADASSPGDIEQATRRLKLKQPHLQVLVVLKNADVETTRQLLREGAADVLPSPVSDPALAISLERAFNAETKGGSRRAQGEVVAFLKAGGGVGATALAVQTAAMLARRGEGAVCIADLDVQFGSAALYLDAADSLTVTDCLAAGQALEDTPFATALTRHASGVRVLAAPRELTPLEALAPTQMDSLVKGLKRDFALTVIDLPTDWTAWTNRALQLTDRILVVTHLTVPHIRLLKRQLQVLISQGLEDRQLFVVCNGLTAEQQATLSLRAAERALGRPFDNVIPEDRKTMYSALNQGLELSAVRKGSKLEKSISELADRVAADSLRTASLMKR